MPDLTIPDRYAEAVLARRAELRVVRSELTGGHRGALRSTLALARLGVAAEFGAELTRLAGQARTYLDGAAAPDRARFPILMLDAVEHLQRWASARRTATVCAAAGRVAARCGVQIEPGCRPNDEPHRPPPPPRPGRWWWPGVVGGWRAALLPAAALPVLGLPMVAGSTPVLLAIGLGIVTAALVGGHYAATADRARLRAWCDELLAAVRVHSEAALARLLIQVEQAAGAQLDAAVARRRAEVDAELGALSPERSRGVAADA